MRKKLIFIGGTFGSGKTTTARLFSHYIKNTIMLDGDWCWEQGCDWHFTDENKIMCLKNVCYLLNNFLTAETVQNIIFSWTLSNKNTYEKIVNFLKNNGNDFEFYNISLICDDDILIQRLQKRQENTTKDMEIYTKINKEKFNNYINIALNISKDVEKLDTIKIDVSKMTHLDVMQNLIKIVNKNNDLIFCEDGITLY